jgi:signal transduction histidine kinase
MFKSFYAKLALLIPLHLVLIAGVIELCVGTPTDDAQRARLLQWLAVVTMLWVALAAPLLYYPLACRLRILSAELETFTLGGLDITPRLAGADANGDALARLTYVVERLAARIVEQIEQIGQIDPDRRELIAYLSHDLRAPLASMRGYLETILLKRGALSESVQHDYLEIAARHTQHLERLIHDLFQLSKLEAKQIEPQLETLVIGELLQDIAQKNQLVADHKSILIVTDASPVLPAISADPGLLERALQNLLENAVRHTPERGTIRLSARNGGHGVLIEVSDTGKGIAPKDLPLIFERYYQCQTRRDTGGGAGLGLAIVRRIVELHHSEIRVESCLHGGTSFSFELASANKLFQRAP